MKLKLNSIRIYSYIPWLTQEVASLTKRKASLWNRNQASKWKITNLVKEYQLVRNKVKKAFIVARVKFENSLSHEKKTKKLFSYINHKQSTATGIQSLVSNGKLHYDKKENIIIIIRDQKIGPEAFSS